MDFELTPRELARQEAAVAMLTQRAADEGLSVDPTQLAKLQSVRMAILTDGGLDGEAAMTEVRRLVPDQVRTNEVKRQLSDAGSALHADIARLSVWQRAVLGHEIEKAKQAAEAARGPAKMSAEEEAMKIIALRKISSPTLRLKMAREWGLA